MNLTYIHLKKCGGTAVQSYFTDKVDTLLTVIPHRVLTENFSNGYYLKEKDTIYFTTIRNPFDFWVSCYFYSRKLSPKDHWFWYGHYKRKDIKRHFEIFVDDMYFRPDENQSLIYNYNLFCFDQQGNFVPDYVVKMENMDMMVSVLSDAVLLGNFPHPEEYFKEVKIREGHHINHTNHDHYSKYYNEQTKGMVSEIESVIIKEYGYKFETK